MNILQKSTFLCFALFALNAQSIYTEDQSIYPVDQSIHAEDQSIRAENQSIHAEDSIRPDFKECKESRHEEQENRPRASLEVDLTRKLAEEQEIQRVFTEEQEAELNKVMNSSVNLWNKPLERISRHSSSSRGLSLIQDKDHIEYHLRKNLTKSTDDAIDNTMIGERAFLLSTVYLAALSNPASASAMIAGSMIYSIYRLQDRVKRGPRPEDRGFWRT